MKFFEIPEVDVKKFDVEDILTASGVIVEDTDTVVTTTTEAAVLPPIGGDEAFPCG